MERKILTNADLILNGSIPVAGVVQVEIKIRSATSKTNNAMSFIESALMRVQFSLPDLTVPKTVTASFSVGSITGQVSSYDVAQEPDGSYVYNLICGGIEDQCSKLDL